MPPEGAVRLAKRALPVPRMASQSPVGVVPGHDIVRTGSGALLENLGGNTIRAAIWAPRVQSQCAQAHCAKNETVVVFVAGSLPLTRWSRRSGGRFPHGRARLAQSISWGPMVSS